VFVALGMLCLFAAAANQPSGGKIGLFWPVAFHIVNSIGFAHVMPVALALFVRLAPRQIASTVVGIYSMAFFVGTALTGWISSRFDTMPPTQFWLLHAGLAALAWLAFWGLKLGLAKRAAALRAVPAL
jgi:proton-dependent oligopeptide transporter, POT family